MRLIAPGRVNTATTDVPTADLLVAAGAVGRKPLVVQALAGQTANLLEVQSSAGAVLASAGAIGNLGAYPTATTWGSSRSGIDTVSTANSGVAEGVYAVIGINARAVKQGTGNLTTTDGVRGANIVADVDGTGNVTELTALSLTYRNLNATAAITTARGLRVNAPSSAGGPITSAFGLDIYAQKVTGVTNGYGVYQRGAADLNYFAGYVNIGNPDATRPFTSQRTFVDADLAANRSNAYFRTNLTPTTTQSTYTNGVNSALYIIPPLDVTLSNIDGSLAALAVGAHKQGDGNVNAMNGISVGYGALSGEGVVTYYNHISVNNTRRLSGAGSIAQVVGLNIVTQSAAHVTTAYGIIQAGVADLNRFNGWIGLGQVPTAARLHFAQDTTAAGGISFGGDVSLYRSAAGVLKTGKLDLGVNELQNAVTHKLATAPASPVEGQRYYDTVSKTELFWNGTAWVSVSGGGAGAVASVDGRTGVVTLTDLYVNVTGDAMSGALDLATNELRNAVTHKLATAPAAPVEGLRYYDTVTKNERVWDGTKWTDLKDVWVGTAAPTGTPTVGDLWWDTDEPAAPVPGAELAYNQITVQTNVTGLSEAAPSLLIEGTSRTYDGAAVIIEFYTSGAYMSATSQIVFNLWDGTTDIGRIAGVINATGYLTPVHGRRRITPTAGTHNFRVVAWLPLAAGSGMVFAGSGAGAAYMPAFIRVTRV